MKSDFYHGLGRRKSAVARARLYKNGSGKVTFNGKPLEEVISYKYFWDSLLIPLKVVEQEKAFDISILTKGGGISSQLDAARLAIAKALIKVDEEFKSSLKKQGLMTTDARKKERKKPGLKKARKAPQYTKR